MALITRSASASVDTSTVLFASQNTGDLFAGEALDALAPCRISSDGLVYMTNATAANAAARIHGYTPHAYASGEAVALILPPFRCRYGTGLTPGAPVFAGATAGRLDTAATTGDADGIGHCISTTDVHFTAVRNAP
jgi:hypothetical protein